MKAVSQKLTKTTNHSAFKKCHAPPIEKYQLPASENYLYIQLKHDLHTVSRNSDPVTMSPMEYLCHKYDKIWGHISELYTILMHTSAKQDYLVKWEQDLQEILEHEEWHSIAQAASKSLINTAIIETIRFS